MSLMMLSMIFVMLTMAQASGQAHLRGARRDEQPAEPGGAGL
ncbi:MAG: hypothetical protein ACLU3I_02900 [Acutalibacteraceae bacterium]